MIFVWADGSCEPNPGNGGWGASIKLDNFDMEISGGSPDTTNNRMELTAALEALKIIPLRSLVVIHSDSQYVIRGMSEWMPRWRRQGLPERNRDLWEGLIAWTAEHEEVRWVWVPGHAGDERQEHADALAAYGRHCALRPVRGGFVAWRAGRDA
jgi:ribonuclease HI